MQVYAKLGRQQVKTNLRGFLWPLIWLTLIIFALTAVIGTGRDAGIILSIFSTRFLGIFIEAAPFLLLGTLASGCIEVFVTRDQMVRWIPRNPIAATFVGAFMGFAFPVCECGVVPVVRRLYNKGLPMSVGVALLLASPVINPVVIASTYIAFGNVAPAVFVGRIVLTFIVATSVGLVFALGARPQDVLLPRSLAPVMGGSGEAVVIPMPRKPVLKGLVEALKLAGDEFFEMGRYLIIGSVLAAALQTLVSQEVLLALGKGPIISVITMQVMAFVLSVCSTVDAFLALAFVGTFTTGSLIAFLTFGPMVDIKSMLMFAGVFKRRTVLYLIILPFLMTLISGIWMNLNVRF